MTDTAGDGASDSGSVSLSVHAAGGAGDVVFGGGGKNGQLLHDRGRETGGAYAAAEREEWESVVTDILTSPFVE